MSQPRKIHLFNCDRTYKFEAVEGLLEATKAKVGSYSVERHYFSLAQMPEMTTKTIPKLDMDFAIFVVHAHESRLSINEDNAGIGYAKIYRALLEATGGNVIIVIGGDDNYKNEDEEDQVVISRWAKRKISSQFKDEFLDGRKSFIFSWKKKHRAIHEEALQHHLDPNKKGLKFEYQPKPKGDGSKSLQSLRRGLSVDEGRKEDSLFSSSNKAGQRREERFHRRSNSAEQKIDDSLFSPYNSAEQRRENKLPQQSSWGYGIPQHGATPSSHTAGGFHPLQPDANFPQETGENSQSSLPTTAFYDPLQSHAAFSQKKEGQRYPSSSQTSSATWDKPNLNSEQVGGPMEHITHSFSVKKQKDLAVLGWKAKPELVSFVMNLIRSHKQELNLAEEPEIRNKSTVIELTSFLENNPLKFCVLFVDAEQVKAAMESSAEPEADYLRLLETAKRNVAAKVIIIVSCQPSLSQEEEEVIYCTIKSLFKEERKVVVTSFKRGKIALTPEQFVKIMMSTTSNTNPDLQERSGVPQNPPYGLIQHPPAQQPVSSLYPALPEGNQHYAHPPDPVVNQPPYSHTGTSNLRTALAPAQTMMLKARFRKGRISNRQEDVVYMKPGFVVPEYIAATLLRKYSNLSEADLIILRDENGELSFQMHEKKSTPVLAPDEFIKLKTRLYSGQISFDPKEVEIWAKNFQVPDEVANSLKSEYRSIPTAKLFIVSDSKGNLRRIVDVGTFNKVLGGISEKIENAFV